MNYASVIGVREGGLYKVTNHFAHALVHSIVGPNEFWHRRFNRLHFKALPRLQFMVRGMPPISFVKVEVCKGCLLWKNAKKSFPHNSRKFEKILYSFWYLRTMSYPSLNGFLCYVLFIVDLSRKCWIYFLKLKMRLWPNLKNSKLK